MKDVEWGEFRLGDLFERIKTKKLPFKADELPNEIMGEYTLPCLTSSFKNQGLNYYAPREGATVLKNVISIPSNSDVYRAYFQSNEFTILSDAYAIQWIFNEVNLSPNQYLFIVQCINKVTDLSIYSYKNKLGGWNVVKNKHIQLPIKNKKIDFDFMESFISELESQKIKNLEAYLEANGLKEYELTEEEKRGLEDFENGNFEWSEINVIDIFDIKNAGNILSRDIVKNSGDVPYLCASNENNGVSSYISYDKSYIDKGNCIFIGGKTFVVSYQEKDFYSNDSHNLALYLKESNKKNRFNQLFLASCVDKGLGYKYSWGDSISNRKIQNDTIQIPTKNNQPDYKLMETLIRAVQKMVIKDVVKYVERKRGK